MRRLLLATTTMLSLCSCHSSSSGPSESRDITAANLVGNWELTTVIIPGGQELAADLISSASQAGYKDSRETLQLKITDRTLTTIMSDGLSVTSQMQSEYRMEGHKLVTVDTPNSKMIDLDVTSLSTDTMTAAVDGLTWRFKRISDAQLATQTLKPLPQHLDYLLTPTRTEGHIDSVFPENPAPAGHLILCRYQRATGLNIGLTAYQRSGTTFTAQGENLQLKTNVTFDFNKKTESVDLTLPKVSDPQLSGMLSGGVSFALDAKGTCTGKVNRSARALVVDATCTGVSIGTKTMQTLTLRSQCVLDF